MNDRKRLIIAIEGIDGAGKTTLIQLLLTKFAEEAILYSRTKKGKLLDKVVSSELMQKHYMWQVPIYLCLSYKNYISFLAKYKNNRIIILDRCYLSNICYFFPQALSDPILLKKLLKWEIKLFPQSIFVLDVDPAVGRGRDNNKKTIDWLKSTREAYLKAAHSTICSLSKVIIVEEHMSISDKVNFVTSRIQGEIENGY